MDGKETEPFFWFTVTNNWNSVCLAGVTGAALALLPDKEERAYFVAMAEKYQAYGMKGYADDGYCSEGVGYYNYGFAAYLLLREEVCRATQGQIDFFRLPKFVHLAQYGKNIQILNGVALVVCAENVLAHVAHAEVKLLRQLDDLMLVACVVVGVVYRVRHAASRQIFTPKLYPYGTDNCKALQCLHAVSAAQKKVNPELVRARGPHNGGKLISMWGS